MKRLCSAAVLFSRLTAFCSETYRRYLFIVSEYCRIARACAKKTSNFIGKCFTFFLSLRHMWKLLLVVFIISLLNFRLIAFAAQYIYEEYESGGSYYCYDGQLHRIAEGPERGKFIRCEDYDLYFDGNKSIKFYEMKEIKDEQD